MNDDSHVVIGNGHTTFVGADATSLFRIMTIRSAIDLYVKCGMKANRAYSPSAMSRVATSVTGKTYQRGELAQASKDLGLWIEAMKAAMPVAVAGGPD